MSMPGYVEYQRREYCKDVRCPLQILLDRREPNTAGYEEIRGICASHCLHSTYEFHQWLMQKGYQVIRPEA